MTTLSYSTCINTQPSKFKINSIAITIFITIRNYVSKMALNIEVDIYSEYQIHMNCKQKSTLYVNGMKQYIRKQIILHVLSLDHIILKNWYFKIFKSLQKLQINLKFAFTYCKSTFVIFENSLWMNFEDYNFRSHHDSIIKLITYIPFVQYTFYSNGIIYMNIFRMSDTTAR